jgi:hypothetical protein
LRKHDMEYASIRTYLMEQNIIDKNNVRVGTENKLRWTLDQGFNSRPIIDAPCMANLPTSPGPGRFRLADLELARHGLFAGWRRTVAPIFDVGAEPGRDRLVRG